MTLATEHQPKWLNNFIENYQQLNTDNLGLIYNIYAPDVTFEDAAHTLKGVEQLEDYFVNLYTNLKSCTFTIDDAFSDGDQAAVYWHMTYIHPSLNKGKAITVSGHSLIKGEGSLVYYHKDYLDMGAMVYEHIPMIGKIIKTIKRRMSA